MKQFEFILVNKDDEESRLDRVIHKKYPYLTQGIIQKSLRNKSIQVNQEKTNSNYRLKLGDYIQITKNLIKEGYNEKQQKKIVPPEQINLLKNNIIYHDDDLLVINKPAGIAVQGGSKIKISIDDIIPQLLEVVDIWYEEKPQHKLVHRLDKETTGILLIALNNKTAKDLSHVFKIHSVEKKYIAVLKGSVRNHSGQIDKNINEEKAITNYKVIARKPQASLVEFRPISGRTHQLRIHSLELGFPILGDIKYDTSLKNSKKENLYLHAAEISIPLKGRILKLTAEPPSYFKKYLKEIFNL